MQDGVQVAPQLFAHHHTIALTQVSCPHRMMVIPPALLRPLRSRPDLAQFEKFEAERFDQRNDAEHRGSIFEPAGEHGLAARQLRHHRGEGGQSGSPEPTPYPDRVQALRCGHGIIVRPDLVSRRRRNQVITRADTRGLFR